MTHAPLIRDLRDALDLLAGDAEQLVVTDYPVDPEAELAGVYKRVGAGGTVARPTKRGPAMLFSSVKGYPRSRVLVGLMADRARVARLLGCAPDALGQRMSQALDDAVAPVVLDAAAVAADPSLAPAQEEVYLASDPDFDIRRLLPAPTNTPVDAGPYFCLGLLHGSDPDTGHSDVTIHRICVQGRDELSIFFAPGRHIDAFRAKAEAAGQPLPVTINMGLDPAITIGACFEAPTTPFGYDELQIAGGLRGHAVELVPARTVDQLAIARAEIVIEGEILPGTRVVEDRNTGTGHTMPEFPGYDGPANPCLPLMRVTAVTTRHHPVLHTLVGPGEEHTSLAGIPTEASILHALDAALPGLVTQVYAHTAGGGKLIAVLQVAKRSALDDGRARQAALVALATYHELKNVILVSQDVDVFDTDDVLWAMTTRMVGDLDIITIPGVCGHVLDPSQQPAYDPRLSAKGMTTKTIYDATYPWAMRETFERAQFLDVDPAPWLAAGAPYEPDGQE
ncbi:UbiD family decarboxylase [Actinomyces urogenitalis]|uniref:UbiD family decarboxylase n=1 Tax=Actinomyces urogenitalis TaxID=103621 RepID=UPI0029009334|nr:UbiD family decarboxylase [Actinomyces urogenitalis]MDU0865234.1 UbiD family decarboxylase [Actinomyces urogenitalis]MDU0875683.1 UbiD family decarboxylase [Actinomyces urogenitalis]MDU1565383.1 UbiD family decarboxylase [Actinomyces urogenitalis]MDU1640730.1 UbiD family decarboxylase [Actinomyces urogenitalis]MDU5426479.1 UbiD family decarboxylase [Actinomyces urogenitalis]